MPHLAFGCMVRIILVPFVSYRDHDDWPPHLSARIGLLGLHRAPPLPKLLAAGLPGSLLLVKLVLDLHRAPPGVALALPSLSVPFLPIVAPLTHPRLLWLLSHPPASQMP